MKKKILIGMISLLCGFLIGKLGYLKYQDLTMKQNEKYYFLQEGIYSNNEFIEHINKLNIKNYLIENKNNKIIVYCAITRDLEVVERIMKIYEEKGKTIDLIERYLHNEEFKNNVDQFDLLINANTTEEEILKIEEVVIANYEEIIKKVNE